jgi:hypothetical protein
MPDAVFTRQRGRAVVARPPVGRARREGCAPLSLLAAAAARRGVLRTGARTGAGWPHFQARRRRAAEFTQILPPKGCPLIFLPRGKLFPSILHRSRRKSEAGMGRWRSFRAPASPRRRRQPPHGARATFQIVLIPLGARRTPKRAAAPAAGGDNPNFRPTPCPVVGAGLRSFGAYGGWRRSGEGWRPRGWRGRGLTRLRTGSGRLNGRAPPDRPPVGWSVWFSRLRRARGRGCSRKCMACQASEAR